MDIYNHRLFDAIMGSLVAFVVSTLLLIILDNIPVVIYKKDKKEEDKEENKFIRHISTKLSSEEFFGDIGTIMRYYKHHGNNTIEQFKKEYDEDNYWEPVYIAVKRMDMIYKETMLSWYNNSISTDTIITLFDTKHNNIYLKKVLPMIKSLPGANKKLIDKTRDFWNKIQYESK